MRTDWDASAVGAWMTPCPVPIGAQATLSEAEELMGEHGIRHLPVMCDGRPIGVLSDRDVAQLRALVPDSADRITALEAMTPVPYVVAPTMSLSRVARRMAAERYGCALVVEGDRDAVLGIFTTIDALRVLSKLLPDG